MAVSKLPVRLCLIDGEAIVCDENGLAVFNLIRGHGSKASAVLCAFDLLELDGRDLRLPGSWYLGFAQTRLPSVLQGLSCKIGR